MADLGTTFSVNRDTVVWAKEESTFGTEVKPAATDAVRLTGDGTISQPRVYVDDPQRVHSYSRTDRLQAGYDPGELSFPTFCKPSGTAGTKPPGAALYKSLFGRETVTPSTSVVYELLRLSDTRPGVTVWLKKGHTVFRAVGCVLNQGVFRIAAGNDEAGFAQVEVSGLFAKLLITGTDEVKTAAASNATAVVVKDSRKFDVGAYVTIGSAGTEYRVTAIDRGTDTLTVSPALGAKADPNDVVAPSVPDVTDSGAPIAGRLGTAQHGAQTLPLLSSELTLNNNVEFFGGEKTASVYPERFGNGARTVDVSVDVRWDANATRFFSLHRTHDKSDVKIPAGSTAGSIVELLAKNVALDFPTVNDDTVRALTIGGAAFAGDALDDELHLTFK